MAEHKFRVGQMVEIRQGADECAPNRWEYKVLRLLPRVAGKHAYLIKTIHEYFGRSVIESDLGVADSSALSNSNVLPFGR